MKGKLVAFAGILCITSLIVSGANAKGKPDKPDKTQTELIVFTGDLQGWAHVEGCCPNAGPFPRYTMYLPKPLVDSAGDTVYPDGTYDGELFMNGYGAGRDSKYIVQFWCCDTSLPAVIAFEIIGGTKVHDKKNKVLTVTFEDEPWWIQGDRDELMGTVSFTITKAQSCTEDICPCELANVSLHLCPFP